jgi:hypothetical protein
MDVSLLVWSVTVGAILLLVIVDLLTVSAKPHEVKFKEAAGWSIFYIGRNWFRHLGLATIWKSDGNRVLCSLPR